MGGGLEGCSDRVDVGGHVVALDCRGGVRVSGGLSGHGGTGAGSSHGDFAGVGVVVGISGGVSRCGGWCDDLSRSEGGLTMSEVVVSYDGRRVPPKGLSGMVSR